VDAAPGERKTAAGRYTELHTQRSPYLTRARDNAKLTIPSLLPPEGSSGATELVKPYQSMGSQGVNNLSAKLLLALFPPNQSFFRISVPDSALAELGATSELRSQIEEGLARIEREVNSEVEASTARVTFSETLKQVIVTGNYCLQEVYSGGLKGHRLDRYVVKRDPAGNVIESVIHEKVAPAVLPREFLAAIKDKAKPSQKDASALLDIYTWLRRDGDKFKVHQEVAGAVVPGTEGTYPVDRCPFIFLRWTKIDGEDYGRSHVDDCFGDLRSLEGLSGAIVEAAAATAKTMFFVDPTGVTRMQDVATAPNLAVRPGRAVDVSVLKADKASDLSVAFQQAGVIERRLSAAFLMTRSVQRAGERVTAEEIRLLASELEDALGGVYALLSQELQLPYVRVLMARLTRAGRIPELPPSVKPTVVTGLQALGRNHELNRLLTFSRAAQELLGPAILRRINDGEVLRRVATATGVDPSGLIRTDEEVAEADAAAQQQALMEKMGPEVIRARAQQSQPQPQEAPSAPQA
jgi:hypothetical protein